MRFRHSILLCSLLGIAGCNAAFPLADDPTSFLLLQRTSTELPGSDHQLRLQIGDIAGRAVLAEVIAADGAPIVRLRPMREGDSVALEIDGHAMSLGLIRLVNRLFGDDYAEFSLGTGTRVEADHIARLLARIEESSLMFVRNGIADDGSATAAHLRREHASLSPPAITVADFINRVASHSSASGEPYLVRDARGREAPLAAWLASPTPPLELLPAKEIREQFLRR